MASDPDNTIDPTAGGDAGGPAELHAAGGLPESGESGGESTPVAAEPPMATQAPSDTDRRELEHEQPAREDLANEEEPAEEEPVEDEGDVEPLEFIDESAESEEELKFDWYILKVQVNREDSIKDALIRRVKIAGFERYFKEIIVPTEDVAEFNKAGKRRIVKRKLYPGYIMVNMHINEESWFLVRETAGIGDFTGSAGRPTAMSPRDVERILNVSRDAQDGDVQVRTSIPFKHGDRVRVKEGYFQNFEGDIESIDEANGRVTVMINIFGRSTPVELEHWQIEAV